MAKSARRPARIVCRLGHRHYRLRYGFDIPYSTSIGPGLSLGRHIFSGGIVVNANAVIGASCSLSHGVTIGAKDGASPVLEDGVHVMHGASVVGGVTLGTGSRVGAGAVVMHDVPPHTTVVGIPAMPIEQLH